ncbi:MAG: acetyl esterase [Actinomycetota bacterium]|nr:acetyl esterase [Actinomycetota bacterium]
MPRAPDNPHFWWDEDLADEALAQWVAETRAHPSPGPPFDLVALRRPRQRRAGPSVRTLDDVEVPGDPPVPARLYRPADEPLPLVVYVHGGGFVAGDLDSHDRTCRRLAVEARTSVLAVDYRLAPEHPAPAAINDVVSVGRWASTRPNVLGALVGGPGLAGDSSGAAIALLAARSLVFGATPASALLLVCPNADLTLAEPSVREKGTGWGLSAVALEWFVHQWVPTLDEPSLRRFSPLHADLTGLLPTIVATAEHDPLHDEGAALVDRLVSFGVEAHHVPHPGLVHGFLGLDDVSPAAREAGTALMRRFGELLPRR